MCFFTGSGQNSMRPSSAVKFFNKRKQTLLIDKIQRWRKSLQSFKWIIPNQFRLKNNCDSPREEETKVRFTMIIPALREANPTELICIVLYPIYYATHAICMLLK